MTFLQEHAPDSEIAGAPTEQELLTTEAALGAPLPQEVRSALAETGGIATDAFGYRVLWRLTDLVHWNLSLREPDGVWADDGPWEARLCFGDDVAGNYFYVDASQGGAVFVWNFIDGEGYQLAASLAEFLARWLGGESFRY